MISFYHYVEDHVLFLRISRYTEGLIVQPRVSSLTLAAGALDEEVYKVQQRDVPVLFVRLDPVIHNRLWTEAHTQTHTHSSKIDLVYLKDLVHL